jgi:hypothetical protein
MHIKKTISITISNNLAFLPEQQCYSESCSKSLLQEIKLCLGSYMQKISEHSFTWFNLLRGTLF